MFPVILQTVISLIMLSIRGQGEHSLQTDRRPLYRKLDRYLSTVG